MATHRYTGHVIDKTSRFPLQNLTVQAFDCAGLVRVPVALATTNTRGDFVLEVSDTVVRRLFGTATPTLYFRISSFGSVLAQTDRTQTWSPTTSRAEVIEIDSAVSIGIASDPTFVVEGIVVDVSGEPIDEGTVEVVSRKVAPTGIEEEVILGATAELGPSGRYSIEYTLPQPSSFTVVRRGEIRVRVMSGATEQASRTVANPAPQERVDLVVGGEPDERYRGRTQYAARIDAVTEMLPLVTESDRLALEDMDPDQVGLVSITSGAPVEEVQRLVDAAKLRADHTTIDQDVFYALLRAGLPTTSRDLFAHRIPTLMSAVEEAVSKRIVSPETLEDPVALKSALENVAIEVLRENVAGELRLGVLVDDAPDVTEPKRTAFIKMAINHTGSSASFWQAVEDNTDFTETDRKRFRFAVEAGAVSGAFLPVVQTLHERVADPMDPLTDNPADMAGYTVAQWRTLINELSAPRYPSDTQGIDDEAKRDAYAAVLARNVERRFRTAVISARVRAAEPTSDLSTFFEDNAEFDFRATRIDRFLRDQPTALDNVDPGDREAVTNRIKEIERVFRVTQTWEETDAVITAGYKSSKEIDDAGMDRFVGEMTSVIGEEPARRVFHKACWVTAAATALHLKYSSAVDKVRVASLPDMARPLSAELLDDHPSIADWSTLFGSPDACSCEHCRSVLGPAAYLADVLQLLKSVGADPEPTAREALFERRPDIALLALSCSNGDTALPYVDLVNEVLEVKTATFGSSWPALPVNVETSLTTDELVAQPEIIYATQHVDAYRDLESAVFPLQLPFHLWQEEARIYLKHMGVRRAELITAMAPVGGAPNPRDLAIERLETTGRQYDIIAGPPAAPPQPYEYWGIASGAWPAALSEARVFLEKSGLSFEELQELLATRYAATNGIAFEENPPCDLDELDLVGLDGVDEAKRQFLHRLLRLRRVLGWSITDTDKARAAFGSLDESALQGIGGVKELERRFGKEPVEFLAWYGEMDRHGAWTPSLFERVFLDKRVLAPAESAFTAVFNTGSSSRTIETVSEGLAAALRLTAAELAILTDDGASDAALALEPVVAKTETLTTERLTRLYRVVSFARANDMSIADMRLVRALSAEPALKGDETAPASPDTTIAFLGTLERVKQLPFTLDEVHYLLRHVAAPESPLLLDEETAEWNQELRDLVEGVAKDAQSLQDPDGARMVHHAVALLGGATLLQQLIQDPAGMTSPTADEFIDGSLAPFLVGVTAAEAITRLDSTTPIPASALPERYEYVTKQLEAFRATRAAVISYVAQRFGLEADVAERVLSKRILRFEAEDAVGAFVPKTNAVTPEGTEEERKELLTQIQKVALFIRRFELTPDELDAFYPAGLEETPPVGGPLPFVSWDSLDAVRPTDGLVSEHVKTAFDALNRIGDFVRLRNRFAGGSKSLLGVLAFAAETPAPDLADVIDEVSAGSGWRRADVVALAGSGLLDLDVASFQDERALVRIDEALEVVKRLGVPASRMTEWIDVEADLPNSFVDPPVSALTIARDIKRAARAKHDESSWTGVARPLRNALRELQRDALVGNLLRLEGLKEPNALYERLLVDVQMDPCALTSRLVLAHSSAQMFIQRIQMNLEEEASGIAPNPTLAKQWSWMRNYRVWEANRKVFLWPENWIEPDLRDDKSPLFKDLERSLLSGPVDKESAEDAYRTYLDGLADLSNLEIVAMHVEKRENSGITFSPKKTIVHVFGRTRKNYTYFYRKREDGRWSAWEKVDAMIEGDHLMPFTFGGRLYLAWAIMQEIDKQTPALDDVSQGLSIEEKILETVEELQQATFEGQTNHADELRTELKNLLAERDALADQRPPMVELTVRIAVSELRRGAWTPPLESRECAIGVSVAKEKLSFRTELFADRIESTLLLYAKFPLATFTFRPGTSSHDVGPLLNVLVDNEGAYGSNIEPGIKAPIDHDPLTFFRTGDTYFRPQAFQGFVAPKEASSLKLYLVENGVSNPLAEVLENGVSEGARLVVDRGPEPAEERRQLIFQDPRRSFYLDLRNRPPQASSVIQVQDSTSEDQLPEGDRGYRIEPFYHPYVNTFRHAVTVRGLDALLRPSEQAVPRLQYLDNDLTGTYVPVLDNVDDSDPFMLENVDFRHGSAFGVYNWELFFHIPLHIADHLSSEGRYEEAQKWLHYIFDPTDASAGNGPSRFWKFRPFAENTSLAEIQDELNNLSMSAYAQEMLQITTGEYDGQAAEEIKNQIAEWRERPFEPHLLARMRMVAYQKSVVMRYIDNLVAWADALFARDSIESINEAAQLYVLALNVLGPKPVLLPEPAPGASQSYAQLDLLSAFDAFSNAIVGTEVITPEPPEDTEGYCGGTEPPPTILWGSTYFCVPPNEKLLGYWDTIADRLFKIRNCMNIEGVVRVLPLFEPPIDPALLVRATAAGVDISTVLFDISAAAPTYRYGVLFGKAIEIASSVASLGATLLSTLEKGDAEELAKLRQRHEVATQEAILQTRRTQLREAQENLRATERSLTSAKERFDYYSSRELVNVSEGFALELQSASQAASVVGQQLHSAAGSAALVPQITIGIAGAAASPIEINTFGGNNVNQQMVGAAKAIEASGVALGVASNVVSTLASYRRRKDDWDHQARLARLEITQIERQIEAARIRVEVARNELSTAQAQITQSKEVERFLKRKFTNQDLYGWMKLEVAKLYYQAYKLAYEVAKRAEKAFQFELGDQSETFIEFGYWENLKKGLLAGERLLQALRRMDAAYIARNKRELELVKMVSLAEHAPHELVRLRELGDATFQLSESDFERDFPGHYLRRLKTVSVTIPCTSGPYQGVQGTLELSRGEVRNRGGSVEEPFRQSIQSICTSQGQFDAGLFELNFRDERFLPFEGVGAHSDTPQWKFKLSPGNRFRKSTIDDLVMDVRYTARPNRESGTVATNTNRKRLVRVADEFPEAWQAFVDNADPIEIELPVAAWVHGNNETPQQIVSVTAYLTATTESSLGVTLGVGTMVLNEELDGTGVSMFDPPLGFSPVPFSSGTPTFVVTPTGATSVTDLWLVFEYTVTVS